MLLSSSRFEELKDELAGYYDIVINDQRRIISTWRQSDAHQVEIVDYYG
jgi:plasmid maintenance system killer protein